MSGRTQLTEDVEALRLLDELPAACDNLADAEAEVADAARLRNSMFVKLRELGVTQRQIADKAGLSEPAVAKAIKKATA